MSKGRGIMCAMTSRSFRRYYAAVGCRGATTATFGPEDSAAE